MTGLSPARLSHAWALLFAAFYVPAAFMALAWSQGAFGLAFVWPGSGIAAAAMMLLKPRARILFGTVISIGGFAANSWAGASILHSTGFAIANLLEALIIAKISCKGSGRRISFDRPRWVIRFAMAACVAALTSSVVATCFAGAEGGLVFFQSWFLTVLLGILLLTPAMISLVQLVEAIPSAGFSRVGSSVPIFFIGLGSTAIAVVTFAQSAYPLLFLPFVAVSASVVFLGVEGATISVVIVAVIGSWFTARGSGPVMFAQGFKPAFFQFYLLVLLGSSLPIAAIIAGRKARDRELRASRDLLTTAAALAEMGYWSHDLEDRTMTWSPQMFTLYGLDPGITPTLETAVGAYLDEDRPRIVEILNQAIRAGERFAFEGRLRSADGTIRHVAGRGTVQMAGNRATGLFGTLIDISEKAELVERLREAHSIALEQAEVATRAAGTDALTGIANRRKAMEALHKEISAAARKGNELAIISVDVDHFKEINDRFGHGIGDEVLKAIALACASSLRPRDEFARVGGEEFLAILPGTGLDQAIVVAERLRQAVRTLDIERWGPQRVSISLGVAPFREGADLTYLLQAADTALYEAKRTGRDRFALAG